MPRRASEPLEKKDIILFRGDWDELAAILAPLKIKPTVYIRALVRKNLIRIRAAAAEKARPTPELSDADLRDLDLLTDESGDTGES